MKTKKVSNQNIILFTFDIPIDLFNLNVFEIGKNKKYIDHKKLDYKISEQIIPSIDNFLKIGRKLKTKKDIKLNLLISGQILSYLQKKSKKTLNVLKRFCANDKINLCVAPYYSSHIKVMNEKEFNYQISLHKNLIKETLNKDVNTLILNGDIHELNLENKTIKNTICVPQIKSGIYNFNKIDSTISIEDELHQKINIEKPNNFENKFVFITQKIFENNKLNLLDSYFKKISKNNFVSLEKISNTINFPNEVKTISNIQEEDMKTHLVDEFKTIHSLITQIDDPNTLEEWRFLSSKINTVDSQTINETEEQTNEYENYINLMNSLNDISYKLKSAYLLKEGFDITEPSISENPSKELKEVIFSNNLITKGDYES